jgi:hypothetical protein
MEDRDQTDTPPPDPRLVAIQEATDTLMALCGQLPDTQGRTNAIAHARSVPTWAAQAIREEASNA